MALAGVHHTASCAVTCVKPATVILAMAAMSYLGELRIKRLQDIDIESYVAVNPFGDYPESARQLEAIRYWLMTNKPEEYFATPDEPGGYTSHDYMVENIKSILMRM